MDVSELVGNYLLNKLLKLCKKKDISLYREDGLVVFKKKKWTRIRKNSKDNSIYIPGERVENNHPVLLKNCELFRYNF